MTIADALRSLSAYPIPEATLQMAAEGQGLRLDEPYSEHLQDDAGFNLACAQLLQWLSLAPDIAQGGQNYTLSDAQRKAMAERAQWLIKLHNPLQAKREEQVKQSTGIKYGYKGSRL